MQFSKNVNEIVTHFNSYLTNVPAINKNQLLIMRTFKVLFTNHMNFMADKIHFYRRTKFHRMNDEIHLAAYFVFICK